jgi:hypothetical protein
MWARTSKFQPRSLQFVRPTLQAGYALLQLLDGSTNLSSREDQTTSARLAISPRPLLQTQDGGVELRTKPEANKMLAGEGVCVNGRK